MRETSTKARFIVLFLHIFATLRAFFRPLKNGRKHYSENTEKCFYLFLVYSGVIYVRKKVSRKSTQAY